ncbi:Hint domain-containing protein [Pseudodonghicola flavimaris]|uniref:Hint domain-containing protein n=1 Tax=Pseudodonghicola flavimaris TaxID=3050036 RepID=A0ABT7EV67_9RHOB|nr:Hint domain-containing protein [Pseudodonghicola flavimaris]MDK3016234.1 Hint domain-containing protein [Pseudodonghicola flavimaris]
MALAQFPDQLDDTDPSDAETASRVSPGSWTELFETRPGRRRDRLQKRPQPPLPAAPALPPRPAMAQMPPAAAAQALARAEPRSASPLSAQDRPVRAFERTFAPGTMLETETGWRPVESLQPGDRVRCLNGMATLLEAGRQPPDRSHMHWQVPAGRLGNCSVLRLNAGQRVALLNPLCKQLFGVPLVLIPVPTITGYCGIRMINGFNLRSGITLGFAAEEVVFAHTGTLLHVPGPDGDLRHRLLSYRESHRLLRQMCQGNFHASSAAGGTVSEQSA